MYDTQLSPSQPTTAASSSAARKAGTDAGSCPASATDDARSTLWNPIASAANSTAAASGADTLCSSSGPSLIMVTDMTRKLAEAAAPLLKAKGSCDGGSIMFTTYDLVRRSPREHSLAQTGGGGQSKQLTYLLTWRRPHHWNFGLTFKAGHRLPQAKLW